MKGIISRQSFAILYSSMLTAQHLRDLADTRLKEATSLLEVGLFDGAVYLAGYALEYLLKARICDLLDIEDLFDDDFAEPSVARLFKTHDIQKLLLLAGLQKKLDTAIIEDALLAKHWAVLTDGNGQFIWNEQLRYAITGSTTQKDAEEFVNAISHSQGLQSWILKQ
jgi:HEPN domain-containing protein